MEEIHGGGVGKGLGAPMPSVGSTLPAPPSVHQPGSFLNPVLLNFYEGFIS